jgi:antirestriction protein
MTAILDNYKDSVVGLIQQLVNNNYALDDIFDFISQHGEDNFQDYYEKYVELGEEYTFIAVDAFIGSFGIENLENFQDAYYGEYESEEQFAEQYYGEVYGEIEPSWVVIDWTATWETALQYDFLFEDGFVFNRNF